jgi:hypothetical protein
MTDPRPAWLEQAIGPRVVGGRYRCGYWQKEYTVTDISWGEASKISYSGWSITVKYEGERFEVNHCTPWSDEGVPRHRKDQVIS